MLATRCVGVFMRGSENLFILARNPHKAAEGEISTETGSGEAKEGP